MPRIPTGWKAALQIKRSGGPEVQQLDYEPACALATEKPNSILGCQHYQQREVIYLSCGETSSAALGPVLGCTPRQTHEYTEVSPAMGHRDD